MPGSHSRRKRGISQDAKPDTVEGSTPNHSLPPRPRNSTLITMSRRTVGPIPIPESEQSRDKRRGLQRGCRRLAPSLRSGARRAGGLGRWGVWGSCGAGCMSLSWPTRGLPSRPLQCRSRAPGGRKANPPARPRRGLGGPRVRPDARPRLLAAPRDRRTEPRAPGREEPGETQAGIDAPRGDEGGEAARPHPRTEAAALRWLSGCRLRRSASGRCHASNPARKKLKSSSHPSSSECDPAPRPAPSGGLPSHFRRRLPALLRCSQLGPSPSPAWRAGRPPFGLEDPAAPPRAPQGCLLRGVRCAARSGATWPKCFSLSKTWRRIIRSFASAPGHL